jgi:hypothetical protein
MEKLIDTMAAVCLDDTAIQGFDVLFYYISEVSK